MQLKCHLSTYICLIGSGKPENCKIYYDVQVDSWAVLEVGEVHISRSHLIESLKYSVSKNDASLLKKEKIRGILASQKNLSPPSL